MKISFQTLILLYIYIWQLIALENSVAAKGIGGDERPLLYAAMFAPQTISTNHWKYYTKNENDTTIVGFGLFAEIGVYHPFFKYGYHLKPSLNAAIIFKLSTVLGVHYFPFQEYGTGTIIASHNNHDTIVNISHIKEGNILSLRPSIRANYFLVPYEIGDHNYRLMIQFGMGMDIRIPLQLREKVELQSELDNITIPGFVQTGQSPLFAAKSPEQQLPTTGFFFDVKIGYPILLGNYVVIPSFSYTYSFSPLFSDSDFRNHSIAFGITFGGRVSKVMSWYTNLNKDPDDPLSH